jgi:hypothetical protein
MLGEAMDLFVLLSIFYLGCTNLITKPDFIRDAGDAEKT